MRCALALPWLATLLTLSLAACGGSSDSAADGEAPETRHFYIDATSGDDNLAGTSQATAWRTFGRLASATVQPGDRVLLKRGEHWRETLTLRAQGSASAPIVVGAYGTGPAPLITGADVVAGWEADGLIFSRDLDWAPGVISVDGHPLDFQEWSGDTTSLPAGAATATHDVPERATAYLRMADDSDPASARVEVARRNYSIFLDGAEHITVQDLALAHARLHCAFLADASHIRLVRLEIRDCGGLWMSNLAQYAGNGVEWTGTGGDLTLEDSHVHGIFDSGASPQLYNAGVELDGVLIRGNDFDRNGFSGVEIAIQPGSTGSAIRNVTIEDNTVRNTGFGWSGNRQGSGINAYNNDTAPTTAIEGTVIRGNNIFNSARDGITLAAASGLTRILRNRIHDNVERGVLVYDDLGETETGAELVRNLVYANALDGLLYHAPGGQPYRLLNNVFHGNGDDATSSANLTISAAPAGNELINNILYGTDSVCRYDPGASVTGADARNNLYYRAAGLLLGHDGVAYTSGEFAAYQSASGTDDQSLAAQPLFTDAALADFSLQADSPAIDAGADLGSSSDFDGEAVPLGGGTDIGAHER